MGWISLHIQRAQHSALQINRVTFIFLLFIIYTSIFIYLIYF